MMGITEDRHIVLKAWALSPAPRSTPRALVADPIAATIAGDKGHADQTWQPCSRRHRSLIESGWLPISCSRCKREAGDR